MKTTAPAALRLGILRLTDAAPVIVAKELGYFAAEGVDAALIVEPSWANIADKLAYGLLDGAMLLPPLALALGLGLSGGDGPEPLIVPSALSLNGNTVTLARKWAEAVLADASCEATPATAVSTAKSFARVLRQRREKPVLGVVHTFSTHHFLLRYWLASGGTDPDREVRFTVVPPSETLAAMIAGEIDGFCAGAPWGELAARTGIGSTVATSHAIWNHGPEKVFGARRAVAEAEPARLQAALRGLLRSAIYCDDAAHAETVADILSADCYLALPPEVILTSLPGAAAAANAGTCVFFANAATVPWRSQGEWFVRQMMRWGYLDGGINIAAATALYRPDLYAEAARDLGLPVPSTSVKSEGRHGEAWLLPASPAPIVMGPDRFVDGAVFDPEVWGGGRSLHCTRGTQ